MPDDLLTSQSAMNRSTRGQWQMYGAHRQQIERLIVPKEPGGRACVLGAGNCNDLDLKWMTQVYREVHLVDLDAHALAQGVKRQRCEDLPRLRLHAPVDLTAVAKLVSHWKQSPPDEGQIRDCLQRMEGPTEVQSWDCDLLPLPVLRGRAGVGVRTGTAEFGMPNGDEKTCSASSIQHSLFSIQHSAQTPTLTLPRSTGRGNNASKVQDRISNSISFDLVLSPCVLSQLLIGIRDAIGSSHPHYSALRAAMRRRHLRAIVDLLAPGGSGVLIVDLASTEDFPGLARVNDNNDDVSDLMRTLVEQRKCFAALAPAEIRRAMQPLVNSGQVSNPRFTRPWIWHLGPHKAFLAYAVLFDKNAR